MENPYQSPKAESLPGPATRTRWAVMAWLCAAAAIAYIQRNSIGVAEEAMREELGLSMKEMGRVMSAFFLTYALFQLPTGRLAQVWGTRRSLSTYSGLWSVAAGGLAFVGGLPSLLFIRLAMGGLQSGIFPAAVNTISKWIPSTRQTFCCGMLGSFMSVGGAIGPAVAGVLMGQIGWRMTFALFSLPGLVWAVWFYAWFRDRPADHPRVNEAERLLIEQTTSGPSEEATDAPPEPTPWRAILSSVPIWGLCGQQVFRAAGYIFFATWFPTFLKKTHGVTEAEAGLMTSLPMLAVVVGSPVGGWCADRLLARTGSKRVARQALASVTQLTAAAVFLASVAAGDVWVAVSIFTFGSFCAAFGGPCAYTASIDLGGRHVPMVFSTMNMAGNLGAVVFPLVVPYLQEASGGNQTNDWSVVIYAFAAMYVFAGLCWLLVDPRHTVPGLGDDEMDGKSAGEYPEG